MLLLCLSGIARNGGSGLVNAAILLAGVVLVVAPWTVRNAVALDRFVPVSTGGGQVLFAGTYLPSDGDPERVGSEVLERHPELRQELPADPRLEQILAALAAQRYPDLASDEALGRMGREQLWDDVTEEPVEYAGFVATKVWRIWSHGPRDVMERPGWEVFHLGAWSPSACSALPSWRGSGAGRRCSSPRSSSRSPRSAPCSSPPPGASW